MATYIYATMGVVYAAEGCVHGFSPCPIIIAVLYEVLAYHHRQRDGGK